MIFGLSSVSSDRKISCLSTDVYIPVREPDDNPGIYSSPLPPHKANELMTSN